MVLVIDVGNTRIKGAVFEDTKLLEVFVFTKDELRKKIEIILKKFKNVSDLVVSSVGDVEKNALLSFENQLNVAVSWSK